MESCFSVVSVIPTDVAHPHLVGTEFGGGGRRNLTVIAP